MEKNILCLLTPKDKVSFIESNMSIRQGLEKLRAHGYSAIPVINEDGTYFGVISEGDFLWGIMDDNIVTVQELEHKAIKEIIRKNVPSCKISVSFEELLKIIVNHNFVPIVDDRNVFMGIITRKAILDGLNKD